jgi:putative restriction endonuclease
MARYFPAFRVQLDALALEAPAADVPGQKVIGRSAAFRKKLLEIYDYQCCACGLRILIPEREITFVDAAHLIPFAESRNDHPTNGLALCKNHHWALDQCLLAPDLGRLWQVSGQVDRRRSKGEEELANLAGLRMLLPHEEAYLPDSRGLAWRHSRLLAG